MSQDPLLEFVQLRARLEAELLDQSLPRGLEGVERIGLTSGAIEREHQRRQQALAEWMFADELLEL